MNLKPRRTSKSCLSGRDFRPSINSMSGCGRCSKVINKRMVFDTLSRAYLNWASHGPRSPNFLSSLSGVYRDSKIEKKQTIFRNVPQSHSLRKYIDLPAFQKRFVKIEAIRRANVLVGRPHLGPRGDSLKGELGMGSDGVSRKDCAHQTLVLSTTKKNAQTLAAPVLCFQ